MVIEIATGNIVGFWSDGLYQPHDITVNAKVNTFFVSDISSKAAKKVHKFKF